MVSNNSDDLNADNQMKKISDRLQHKYIYCVHRGEIIGVAIIQKIFSSGCQISLRVQYDNEKSFIQINLNDEPSQNKNSINIEYPTLNNVTDKMFKQRGVSKPDPFTYWHALSNGNLVKLNEIVPPNSRSRHYYTHNNEYQELPDVIVDDGVNCEKAQESLKVKSKAQNSIRRSSTSDRSISKKRRLLTPKKEAEFQNSLLSSSPLSQHETPPISYPTPLSISTIRDPLMHPRTSGNYDHMTPVSPIVNNGSFALSASHTNFRMESNIIHNHRSNLVTNQTLPKIETIQVNDKHLMTMKNGSQNVNVHHPMINNHTQSRFDGANADANIDTHADAISSDHELSTMDSDTNHDETNMSIIPQQIVFKNEEHIQQSNNGADEWDVVNQELSTVGNDVSNFTQRFTQDASNFTQRFTQCFDMILKKTQLEINRKKETLKKMEKIEKEKKQYFLDFEKQKNTFSEYQKQFSELLGEIENHMKTEKKLKSKVGQLKSEADQLKLEIGQLQSKADQLKLEVGQLKKKKMEELYSNMNNQNQTKDLNNTLENLKKQQELNEKEQALNEKEQALNEKEQALNEKEQALNEMNDRVLNAQSTN